MTSGIRADQVDAPERPDEDADWDELDDIADASQEVPDSVASSVKPTLAKVSATIAALDAKFDLDNLNKLSRAEGGTPGDEDFDDDTASPALDHLTTTLATALGSTTDNETKLARAKFLAMQFGYAATERAQTGSDADQVITLLGLAAKKTPDRSVDATVADAVDEMANAWAGEPAERLVRMADRFGDVFVDRDDLPEHMIWMGHGEGGHASGGRRLDLGLAGGHPAPRGAAHRRADPRLAGGRRDDLREGRAAHVQRRADPQGRRGGARQARARGPGRPEPRGSTELRRSALATTAAALEADTRKDVGSMLGLDRPGARPSNGAHSTLTTSATTCRSSGVTG